MRRSIRGAVLAAAALWCTAASSHATPAPEDSAFVYNAIDTLVYHTITSPPDNSEANLRSRFTFRPETRTVSAEYLERRLRAILEPAGGTVTIESFPTSYLRDTIDLHGTGYNIVGRLPRRAGATGPPGGIVLCAHYDAIAIREASWLADWATLSAPGANDNGTGIASVLLAAQYLSQYAFDTDVYFVLFDAEEILLQGSDAFIPARRAAGDSITLAIDIDEIGYNPDYLRTEIVDNGRSRWVGERLRAVNARSASPLEIVDLLTLPGLLNSDQYSFWVVGQDAVGLFEHYRPELITPTFRGNPVYHTRRDVIDSVRVGLVTRVADMVWRCVADWSTTLPDGTPGPLAGRGADLTVATGDVQITWSRAYAGAPAQAGQAVTVFATVHNSAGGRDGIPLHWTLSARGPRDATDRVLTVRDTTVSLPTAGTVVLAFPWQTTVDDVGQHTITLDVQGGEDAASSASDNRTTGTVVLETAQPRVFDVASERNPVRSGEPLRIRYQLAQQGGVTIDVLTIDGRIVGHAVRPLTFSSTGAEGTRAGENVVEVPLAQALPPGAYLVRVSAVAVDGRRAMATGTLAVRR